MNLNHLKVFVTVAQQGSLLATSKSLGIPNSTIGRHLTQFESEMGMQLVMRNTRHLRLTNDGKRLYERAEGLVSELEEIEHEIKSSGNDVSGKIIIAIPSEFGVKWLNKCIADFVASHPKVSVECITSMASLDPVRRDVDVSIVYHRGKLQDSSMVVRHLLKMPSVVVAAPKLIDIYGRPSSIDELKNLPCISTLTALQANPWHFVDHDNRLVSMNVKTRYRVDSSQMLISGAIAGIGYAIIPQFFCQDFINNGQLDLIELDLVPAPLEIIAVFPNRLINQRLRLLMDVIGNKFEEDSSILKDFL